jgi:hypothetical protein
VTATERDYVDAERDPHVESAEQQLRDVLDHNQEAWMQTDYHIVETRKFGISPRPIGPPPFSTANTKGPSIRGLFFI